jgi:septum formation inhibitor MinC
MDASSAAASPSWPPPQHPVLLRGTRTGLEIQIDASVPWDVITRELSTKLEQAPRFFAGNEVSVRIDGALPPGCLGQLEQVVGRFELRIAELSRREPGPVRAVESGIGESGATPGAAAGIGTGDSVTDDTGAIPAPVTGGARAALDEAGHAAAVTGVQQLFAAAGSGAATDGTPLVINGPVRSGSVIEGIGDIFVVGDVNPGAELRAGGSIVVVGRLRGLAHAAASGQVPAFILALRLEPPQLRIGGCIARAGDTDRPAQGAEIAYVSGAQIVVEQYHGKLPDGLRVVGV